MNSKTIEFIVGIFMLAGLFGLIVLAFEVSGLTQLGSRNYYQLSAEFDNIGDLRVRSPVRIGGVTVGRVTKILLDSQNFRAKVFMQINKQVSDLPSDTSASILTEGLLGSNYIGITPGFETQAIKANGNIETTHSALILENLLGQLIYSLQNKDSKSSSN